MGGRRISQGVMSLLNMADILYFIIVVMLNLYCGMHSLMLETTRLVSNKSGVLFVCTQFPIYPTQEKWWTLLPRQNDTFVNFWADFDPLSGTTYILAGDENSLYQLNVVLYAVDKTE
eukprot:TRINITY_DN16315_c0_g1_i1.p1 TRINITY_DN16315_c0_g1~~TRINITY_DN16315_c0_g1_i1.p1  ORF type:complete len:117 (+),score=10.49 TRINITY_DN16315_c0_g1_i1:282-632(+)